jgi:uncharacterized membrane protein HdeD (DUF308 family)
MPLAAMVVGAAAGAPSGPLSDYGINDTFIKDLPAKLQPGSSALFVVVRKATPDKVLPEVSKYGGIVLHASLSNDAEARHPDRPDRGPHERDAALPRQNLRGIGMLDILARNWWAIALRGLFAVLFGVAAFIWPGLTLTVLVLLWGAYALVDGIFALVAAFRAAEIRMTWWPLVINGLLGIAAGVVAFVWPGITVLALLYLIAAWAILTGIAEIVAAVRLRRVISGEWLLGLAGLLSIFVGVILIASPSAGALAVAWMIGAYAVIFGIVLIVLGFRLRGLQHGGGEHARPAHT